MRTHVTSIVAIASCLLPVGALVFVGCGPDSSTGSSAGGGSSGDVSSSASTSGASTSSSSSGAGGSTSCAEPQSGNAVGKRAIIFVWDGMRPDVINATDTPNLHKLGQDGVVFKDNHSTYPTFTMMNSASFATGAFPGTTGFYGNTFWAKGAMGSDSAGKVVDFDQPVFTEDYAVLSDLDAFYSGQLLLVGTLFQAAHAKGLKTATVGKTGAAFLQDIKRGGSIIDEKMVWPLKLAKDLQTAGFKLPKLTPLAYQAGEITVDASNGDPTAALPKKLLKDGVTTDASDAAGSPVSLANAYLMDVYLNHILPQESPDLSVIWMRNPDTTQHIYGPGSANFKASLKDQDILLGKLQDKLEALGLAASTNIIIVSDHAHSNVAGPASLFPLRAITANDVGEVDPAGYSVSGDVRLADLLTRAGFTAFDGVGCILDPALSGITAAGNQVYTTQTDLTGTECNAGVGKTYTTGSFKVPETLPTGAVVIAANGGSEYLYVPDHDPQKVKALVSFLQSREEFGAVFVASQYGAIDGTIPMDTIKVENKAGRSPDIIVSYTFDENAQVQGLPGIEFETMATTVSRGMHGSFSPIDVHNTLLASGPDFLVNGSDTLPTGNVDVAPTVAFLLGLSLPEADGRPLFEALKGGVDADKYEVKAATITSTEAKGLTMKLPTNPDGLDIDVGKTSYQINLQTKTLTFCGKSTTYFDSAHAVRK